MPPTCWPTSAPRPTACTGWSRTSWCWPVPSAAPPRSASSRSTSTAWSIDSWRRLARSGPASSSWSSAIRAPSSRSSRRRATSSRSCATSSRMRRSTRRAAATWKSGSSTSRTKPSCASWIGARRPRRGSGAPVRDRLSIADHRGRRQGFRHRPVRRPMARGGHGRPGVGDRPTGWRQRLRFCPAHDARPHGRCGPGARRSVLGGEVSA